MSTPIAVACSKGPLEVVVDLKEADVVDIPATTNTGHSAVRVICQENSCSINGHEAKLLFSKM